eukprot:scaffold17182_cov75-Phaeocystis_antarctica.AAC.2
MGGGEAKQLAAHARRWRPWASAAAPAAPAALAAPAAPVPVPVPVPGPVGGVAAAVGDAGARPSPQSLRGVACSRRKWRAAVAAVVASAGATPYPVTAAFAVVALWPRSALLVACAGPDGVWSRSM